MCLKPFKKNNFLVSKSLSHSYSKIVHNLFGYEYHFLEIEKASLDFDFGFINVTIPFKEDYYDLVGNKSEIAKLSKAINLIVKKDGDYFGYNTDYYGIDYTFIKHNIDLNDKKVLILGDGASTKTILVYLKNFTDQIKVLSRKDQSYQNNDYFDSQIIINTAPNAMFPNIDFDLLVDLTKFNRLEFVFDLVYNPFRTPLIQKANELGLITNNGLDMLVYQAKKAYDILGLETVRTVEDVVFEISKMKNILLIGPPASGKSTIGKELLKLYPNKELIEFDLLNEVNILEDEQAFRSNELELAKTYAFSTNKIISPGGGIVLNELLMKYLKLNSLVFYLDFEVDELLKRDYQRALIKDEKTYLKVYNERLKLYQKYADYSVRSVGEIIEILNY